MRTAAFALVATLILSCFGPLARAQDFEAAGKHFQSAQEAFRQSHFRTAADQFQAAFDITKDPILLYNIGEAWQKGGDGHKAVSAYKAYLKAQPTAQDRAEVQKRIRLIESKHYRLKNQSAPGDNPNALAPPDALVAPAPTPAPVTPPATTTAPAPEATTPPPPAAPAPVAPAPVAPAPTTPAAAAPAPATAPAPAPVQQLSDQEKSPPAGSGAAPHLGFLDESRPTPLRVGAWIGVAATVGVLTTAAILGLAAQSRADEISRRFEFVDSNGQPKQFDASQQSEYRNLKNEGELYNDVAIGFFAGAGALAVVTTVLFAVDYTHGKKVQHAQLTRPRLLPVLSKSGAGLAAEWRF